MKKILVTGGTGFIGHHLANALHDQGNNVTVVDIAYNNYKQLRDGINFILQDIRAGEISGSYDNVYHLAAKTSVPLSFDHPQDFVSTNVWGSYNVMSQFPCSRFINISSSSAKGNTSVYGITKKSSEHLMELHKNSVSARLFNVIGERQSNQDMVIPAFMHAIKHGHVSTMYGTGKTSRDYTYVLDVVNELIKLGNNKRRGVTDIGYGKPIGLMTLHKRLCSLSKKKSKIKFAPERKGAVKRTCSKYPMKEPQYGFTEGLRRTVRWYLKDEEF